MIIGIDPGTFESAYVGYVKNEVICSGIRPNIEIVRLLQGFCSTTVAVEYVRSYGNIIGQTTLETCVWIGKFQLAAQDLNSIRQIPRKEVCKHVCNDGRAKDSNIRAALIDRYGGTRQKAIGTKKNPGPLYGFKSHLWSALAVAITADETDIDYRFEE